MKSYWKIIFSTLLFITIFIASAQEVCNNGTDDDGDGLIDCYDGDCSDNADCDGFFFGNQVECADDINVTTFAIREQWRSADQTATSQCTPAVGDLDGNGIPEVVSVNNFGSLDLYVLNGATGETIASIDIGFTPENAPVLVDVDADGIGEIIVSENKGNRMAMYNVDFVSGTLTERWSSTASINQPIGLHGVADFDEDGDVEIYYRNEIMDASTGSVVVAGDGTWEEDYTHGSIAVDILADSECTDCAGLELISGNEIWAINEASGTRTLVRDMDDDIHDDIDPNLNYYPKYYNAWNDQFSAASVADYNLDGSIDVLLTGALGTSNQTYQGETTVFFWDVANGNVVTYHDPTNNFVRGPGRINIGDVDGDGQMNANFVMDQKLYSLDENFNIHWIHPIKEGSSGFTGCSLFDFDGDGAVEVVYRSESALLIIDGVGNGDNTTTERREMTCVSRTQEEYPVIADVDGDGSSEICVTCYFNSNTPFNPYQNTQFSSVRVFESDGEAWMPARQVWNQHGYYNVNINDDLTIPTEVQDHSLVFSDGVCEYADGTLVPFPSRPLNSFLNQAPVLNQDGCVEFASPDIDFVGILGVTDAVCPDAKLTVDYQITNIGDIDISGVLPVSYYSGDPRTASATLLDTEITLLENFEVGQTLNIEQTIQGIGGDFELFVVINDNGSTPPIPDPLPTSTIPECETGNNIQSTFVGFQEFMLTVDTLSFNRKCEPTKPDNGAARAYYFGEAPGDNETIWFENFEDRANGDRSDTDETAWTSDGGTRTPGFYGVRPYNGSTMFGTTDTGARDDIGVVTWTSEAIDVSDYTDINIGIDLFENGNLESSGSGRDFIIVEYELRDNNNAFTEGGVLNNGLHYGNFDYERALIGNLNSDGADSLLILTVEIHSTNPNESHYVDNISVEGTGQKEIREFTEPDGFVFRWYNDNDYSTIIYEGSLNTQMPEGEYDVIGFFEATQCYSDTVDIGIELVTDPTFYAWAYEISPETDCEIPNGSVAGFVYTTTTTGIFPANVADSNFPEDTIYSAAGYDFIWSLASDGLNTPIGIGDTLEGLSESASGYLLTAIENLSGCDQEAVTSLGSNVVRIDASTIDVSITNINTCGGTGQVSASIGGNTSDFTFFWYDGNGLRPTPDFTGPVYTVSQPGSYTVTVQENSSSCISDNFQVVEVLDESGAPLLTANEVSPNTNCGSSPTGSAEAVVNGTAGSAGFTYRWFFGNNTLNANELPGSSLPSASLGGGGANQWQLEGLTEGTYTVIAEETATSCTDTTTVQITESFSNLDITFNNELDTEEALNFSSRGHVNMPQLFSESDPTDPDAISEFTVSLWVNISGTNYANDERIFSAGNTGEERTLLWTDNTDGLSFTVQQFGGGSNTIRSGYFGTGWTHVSGVWNENTGEMRLYVNGIVVRQVNFSSTGPARGVGSTMYIGRNSQGTTRTLNGTIDEFRIFDRALDEATINQYLCTQLTGSEPGLILYYDFNGLPAGPLANGTTIPDQSGNGNNGSAGSLVGSTTIVQGDVTCPIADVVANSSCGTPNGSIDISGFVVPAGVYTYNLYQGFTTDVLEQSNTSGLFEGLASGFYTITAEDPATNCITDPVVVTIPEILDVPTIFSSITDDPNCVDGAGEVFISSSSREGEPSSYTYELFRNFRFNSPVGSPQIVADGATGFTFTGLRDGRYRVRVTNGDNTCSNFIDFVINDVSEVPEFSSSRLVNDNTSCDNTNPNGFVSVSIDGADVNDFNFSWYDGANASSPQIGITTAGQNFLDDLTAGDYTVVAQDIATGCFTVELTLTVNDDPYIPNIVITEDAPQTNCSNANGQLSAVIDNSPDLPAGSTTTDGFSFQWYFDGNPITNGIALSNGTTNPQGATTPTLQNIAAGTYTLEVTHVGASGNGTNCTAVESFVLTENLVIPTVALVNVNDNSGCDPAFYNGSIEVSGSPAGMYTYAYFYSDGSQVVDGGTVSGSTTANVTGLVDDIYTVIATSDLDCESNPITVIVDQNLPTISVAESNNTDNTVCVPDGVGGNPDANGAITLTPSTANPTVEPTGGYNFALETSGGTAIDNAGSTTGFQDVAYDLNGTSTIVTGLPAGNYIMAVTNADNSCPTTYAFTIANGSDDPVIDQAALTASATDNTVCIAPFNGSASASVSGGSGTYSYAWAIASDPGTIIDTDATLSNVGPEDYILTVTDQITGCTSAPASVTIGETIAPIDIATNVLSIDYTCDPSNPSGSISAEINGGGNTGFTFNWYAGTSAAGSIIQTTTDAINTLTGQSPGSYTVEVINNMTGCTETETIEIIEDTPTISASITKDSDQTQCNPADGQATVNPSVTFSGIPTGFTANYTFQWYAGQSTTTPLAGETNATLSSLVAGFYTVVVTETSTGCFSNPVTVEILDNTPAPPTITLQADVIPGSCNAVDGEISATVTGGSGPFTYFWYEGSDDFATNDPTGANALSSGTNQLVADPSVNISVSDTELDNIISGLYTLVVQDNAGCRYQESFDLPFNGIQTTTTLTVTDVSQCPDNGEATVSLADNVVVNINARNGFFFTVLESYTTSGGATGVISRDDEVNELQLSVTGGTLNNSDIITGASSGAVANITSITSDGYFIDEADDIDEYIVYLYAGSGVPADRFAPYTIVNSTGVTLTFPYTYDPVVGDVEDGNGNVIQTPGTITFGNSVTFVDLPAGPYTAIAREKATTNFGSTSQCWTTSANDEIIQEAYKPIITSVDITDDTECNPTTGNGSITVNAIKELPGDNIQPNNFEFEWYSDAGLTMSIQTNNNVTTSTLANRNAGDYWVTVRRLGLAGPASNSCDTTAMYTIFENQEVHEINTPTVTVNAACDPLDGAITINDGDITDNVADYTFTWYSDYTDATTNTLLPAANVSGGANPGAGAGSAFELEAGTYFVEATHNTKGCVAPVTAITVDDDRLNPAITVVATQDDISCVDDATRPATGQAVASVNNGSMNVDDYEFTWYFDAAGTDLLDPSDDPALVGLTFDGTGSLGLIANGQLGVNRINGLPSGITYYVQVEDPTNPGEGCLSPIKSVEIDPFEPTISVGNLAGTDFDIQDNEDCDPSNGAFEILRITETRPSGTVTNATMSDYSFNWYQDDRSTLIATPAFPDVTFPNGANGTTGASSIAGLPTGTYYVQVTNEAETGCTQTADEFVAFTIDDVSVDPIVNLSGSITPDTFCDNSGNQGDGQLAISVEDEGGAATLADFDIVWYRGDTPGVDEIFPTDGGTRGSAVASADNTSLTGLATGDYTVVITKTGDTAPPNGNIGCTVTATYNVGSNVNIPTLDLTAVRGRTIPDTFCGTGNGAIILDDVDFAPGVIGDYTITVEDGSGTTLVTPPVVGSTLTFSNLEPDDYTVSAFNNTTGCEIARGVVNVGDDSRDPLITLESVTPDNDCSGAVSSGELEILVDGVATGPYDIQWSIAGGALLPGETSTTLSNRQSDDYEVIVTNTNTGCSSTKVYNIPEEPVSISIIDFQADNKTFCSPDNGAFEVFKINEAGVVVDTTAMEAANYELVVFTDAMAFVGNATSIPYGVTDLAAGEYIAIVTNNDTGCESAELIFTIEDTPFFPEIVITLDAADSTCAPGGTPNGTLTALADGQDDSNTNYSFQWYFGAAADIGGSAVQLMDGTPLANGSDPVGSDEATVSGLVAGTYSVQVTQANTGCVSTAQFTVPNAPTDVEIISVDVTDANFCVPANGIIEVTSVERNNNPDVIGDYTFAFYSEDPNNAGATPVFTVPTDGALFNTASAGIYFIVGTNNIVNCTTPVFQVEVGEDITNPVLTNVVSEPSTNCEDQFHNGSISIFIDDPATPATDEIVPAAPNYTVAWYFGAGTGNPLDDADLGSFGTLSGETTASVTGLRGGEDYTVVVTEDASGCSLEETFTLPNDANTDFPLRINVLDVTNCSPPNGLLTAAVIGDENRFYDFYWFAGAINTPDSTATGSLLNPMKNNTITDLPAGDYTVLVANKSDRGCTSVETTTVLDLNNTNAIPYTLQTSNVTVCFAEKDGSAIVRLDSAFVVNNSVSIQWFNDVGNVISTSNAIIEVGAGQYRLVLTDAITGCETVEVFDILDESVIPSAPTLIVNNGRTNCDFANGNAIANVDGVSNNFLFEWFDQDDMDTPYAIGSQVNNLDTTTYLVRATNLSTGCVSPLSTVEVNYEVVDPEWEIAVVGSVCLRTEDGSVNQFTGQADIVFSEFNDADSVTWIDETGLVVSQQEKLIDAIPGTYTVTFKAQNGCIYEDTFTIETAINIYNGVSANDDGFNDFFLIDCLDYFPNNNVQIFTRDGVRIYEVDNYNNTDRRFDGTSNVGGSRNLPSGTYFYVIDKGDGSQAVQGYLELVR